MIQLEFLNEKNEEFLKKIQRDDIPLCFANDISNTIDISKYGENNNLKGHCYAIKYGEDYVGIILIGQALEDEADPSCLKGNVYFRVLGFVIDKRYRNKGIGSNALRMAIQNIYCEYGEAPMVLECHKDNGAAIKFYKNAGFRNTKILHAEDYYFIK
jgi:ribosomal protein S18 acetylase RimI-like enzyme